MACVVPSRFASLKIVEDDFVTSKVKETSKDKKNDQTKNVKKNDDKKTKATSKNKQTNKAAPSSHSGSQGKKKHPPPSAEQWEAWKEKDNQLVDGSYEDDLSQAILLSKLDFEEKKKIYKSTKKESDTAKKLEEQLKAQGNKKSKKNKTMSLGQFNELVTENNVDTNVDEEPEDPDESFQECRTFFDRVKRDATDELVKENLNRTETRSPSKKAGREPPSNDEIKGSKLQSVLEIKDKEIEELRAEVDTLKTDLLKVKSRNKKLCSIIGQGEMKDKAEVLVEVERLREVQAELTAEVASLHAQLEQQKSRGSAVRPDTKQKDTKKKKIERES